MYRLRSVGVLSAAKLFAVIQGAIGIIIGFIIMLVAIAGAAIAPAQQKLGMAGMMIIAVLAPFFYAAIGFVGGAIWAFVYNLAAGSIGGLELQLDIAPVVPVYAPQAPVAPPVAGV